MKAEVQAIRLENDGVFPNNPRLPVLIYQGAFAADEAEDLAATIEKRFNENRWNDSWQNGVYGFQHFHSTSHEVLGVSRGWATLQLGGPGGTEIEVAAGDVVVLPAGTAHKNLGSSSNFEVVGAYPEGLSPDMRHGKESEHPAVEHNIAKVPLPHSDPVFGAGGPLFQHWKARTD